MKPINFIHTKNKKEQLEMHRWFWYSTIILTTLLLCIAITQIRQYHAYKKLQDELIKLKPLEQELNDCLTEKRKIKEQTTTLKNISAKIGRIKHKPKNPAATLQTVQRILPEDEIQEIVVNKKKIDLIIATDNTTKLMKRLEQLKAESSFKQVSLGTVEQLDTLIKATIIIEMK